MIVVMKAGATPEQTQAVVEKIKSMGFGVNVSQGAERLIIGVLGVRENKETLGAQLGGMPSVERVMPISKPFKLVSREGAQSDTIIRLPNGAEIGGTTVVVMAGPCTVEGREMMTATAKHVKACGATMLRGGAYKPSSSPYSFQGMGKEGLEILAEARSLTGLPVITEVLDPRDVPLVEEYADILQIGARNMQNFALLRRLATVNKPVLLKRGPSATVKEWLLAAEYLLSGGNSQVVLCERGIKTFETEMRNTFDLAAVALARDLSHLPVIADPSHGTGKQSLIAAVSRAAVAVGADGLIIEVHPCPERALSDGAQSLDFAGFGRVMRALTEPLRQAAVPLATVSSALG
jgi:3-deoxy-7-phosphoheptulonate synthase